jgi:hypothetical protein
MKREYDAYRILARKPPGKCYIGRRRYENNIKMDLKEIRCEDGLWI